MRLFQHKEPSGNFGDDLNGWLWPRLFNGSFESAAGPVFIGIGSVLDGHALPPSVRQAAHKVVFGAGARSEVVGIQMDKSWDIRFVRGPLTAAALEPYPARHITDGAACIALLNLKRDCIGGCAFMPYFMSVDCFHWASACEDLGMTYIDPRWPVEKVLSLIASSSRLVTEAMHGAVIADALRVPWMSIDCFSSIYEGEETATFKWKDWASSVGLSIERRKLVALFPPSPQRQSLAKRTKNAVRKALVNRQLRQLLREDSFQLSGDRHFESAVSSLRTEVEMMRDSLSI